MIQNSKSVGNKITAARKKSNLSQADLAQQVSISPQAVGKWERGESMPDITTLNRLAAILGVDLNYFSDNFHTPEAKTSTFNPLEIQTEEISSSRRNKRFGMNWDMSEGNWVDADFSGLNNLQEKLSCSNMKNCKFMGSDLTGLTLKDNNIENCDFSNSNLRNSKIQSSNLSNSLFLESSLIDAELSESEIKNCTFSNANLSGAEFTSVNFQQNKIENTLWKFTSFKLTHISNIVFNGLMEDCAFDNCSFSKVAFQNAKILNTFFKGKKLKGIQFINSQADRMSYEFLKNGKADVTGLTLLT